MKILQHNHKERTIFYPWQEHRRHCWITFALMSCAEATELWQEETHKQSRSSNPPRERATNQLECTWCFKLMIIPWRKWGQASLCLLLVVLRTTRLCPLMVKYTSVLHHVVFLELLPPRSFFPNLLSSSTLLQLFRVGEVGTPGPSSVSTDIVVLTQ